MIKTGLIVAIHWFSECHRHRSSIYSHWTHRTALGSSPQSVSTQSPMYPSYCISFAIDDVEREVGTDVKLYIEAERWLPRQTHTHLRLNKEWNSVGRLYCIHRQYIRNSISGFNELGIAYETILNERTVSLFVLIQTKVYKHHKLYSNDSLCELSLTPEQFLSSH